jgi:uncharacterized protein with GYD domain
MTPIVLVNFTPDSMPEKPSADWHDQVLREEVERLASCQQVGGQLRDLWWTLGSYDVVIVIDVSDPVKLAAFSLTLSEKFHARTTSLPALTTDEMNLPVETCQIKDGLSPKPYREAPSE